jgi:hypothetical protein
MGTAVRRKVLIGLLPLWAALVLARLVAPADVVRARAAALQAVVGSGCNGQLGVTWYPATPIYASQTFIAPGNGTTFPPGATVTLTAPDASDMDAYNDCGVPGNGYDGITYSWSGPNGLSGSGQETTWTLPTASGSYTATVTIDDTHAINPNDSGNRDDGPVTRTVMVYVGASPSTWWPDTADAQDTPIQCDVTTPVDNDSPLPGEQVACSATVATDKDKLVDEGVTSYPSDDCTYKWSADGGTFLNNVTDQRNVTWIAPQASGDFTIALTIDDKNDANKNPPTGAIGSRNDPKKVIKRAVKVWNVISPKKTVTGQARDKAVYDVLYTSSLTPFLTATSGNQTVRFKLEADAEANWSVSLGGGVTASIVDLNGNPITSPTKVGYVSFNKMPTDNSGFGAKTVTAQRAGRTITRELRVFYKPAYTPVDFAGAAHPPISGNASYDETVPNWFFYGMKIAGVSGGGTFLYDCDLRGPNNALGTGITRWEDRAEPKWPHLGAWTTFIGPGAWTTIRLLADWGDGRSIDNLAWTCRHESLHKQHVVEDWGNTNRDPTQDTDNGVNPSPVLAPGTGDFLKDTSEPTSRDVPLTAGPMGHPASFCRGDNGKTFEDHWNYGVNFSDSEEYALHHQARWTNGSVNSLDWSEGGWQWTNGL